MSVPSPGYQYPYNTGPQIDIGWLTRGWQQFKKQAGTWIAVMLLVGLIVAALSVGLAFATGYAQYFIGVIKNATHGIIAQPQGIAAESRLGMMTLVFGLLGGGLNYLGLGCYYRMALSQLRGEPVGVGTAFSALRSALPLFVIGLTVQSVAAISGAMQPLSPVFYYLLLIPAYIVQGLFMFAPLLVLDRGLGPVAALTESFQLVKSQWIMATVFFFLGQLLAGVGALLCGVGALVTYPLFILGVTIGYLTLTNPPTPPPPPDYGPSTPGVWPPPPGSNPTW